jgi:uncharacterized membrane protein YsdA (DUF1294 family)
MCSCSTRIPEHIILRRDLLGGGCGVLSKYEARHNSHAAFRAEVNFVKISCKQITEILQLVKIISFAISCDFSAILLLFCCDLVSCIEWWTRILEYILCVHIPHVFWIT